MNLPIAKEEWYVVVKPHERGTQKYDEMRYGDLGSPNNAAEQVMKLIKDGVNPKHILTLKSMKVAITIDKSQTLKWASDNLDRQEDAGELGSPLVAALELKVEIE